MMSGVLEAVLSTFECDRAWLVYPCDPEAPSWGVAMEHTRSEFPGAFVLGRRFPASPDIVEVFRTVRASSAPVRFGPGSEHPLPADLAERFSIQSQIATAVYPKVGEPYMFGLHQCSYPRVWTPQEEILFKAIGRRLADALTSLLIFRNLRQSEARLAEAERIAHVGYWHRDLDTDRLTWSEETYRIFGLAPQEGTIDFTGFQELIHPEDRQIMARAVAQTLHGGPRYDVEYRVVRPNGEVRIVHSQGDVTRDESGRFGRMLGTIQDITDRKQAEEELRESERRYRYIFDSTGVSIWEEDFSEVKDAIDDLRSRGVRDFREYFAAHPEFVQQAITMVKIVDVNNASVKLFAAESKDELLVSLHRVFTPETQEVFVDELIAIAEGRTSFGAETVLRTLRGERLTALFTITFPGPSARFDGVLVTVVDITERKRAEYLTGQVFESSPDRISIIGRDYRYQRVNPVFERYWGVPAEKAVGMRVPDVLGVEVFEDRVRQNLDRCFAGEDASYAGWFGNARGRRYVAVSFSPLRPDSERVEAALVIGRDLTEYMLASEALHQAQAELAHVTRVTTLGELAASIAHEVNQPLAAIVADANASLNWLAATDPDLDEVRDALAAIVKDGHRAAEVIQRIRQLATKTDPQKVPIDVNEIIRDVVPLVHPEVRRYHVSLRVELASALTPVLGDRVQLQQVILNLVMNGIEAMASVGERPRELVIRSGPHDHDHIVVAVQDAGVGIDPKNLDQLFSAFFTTKPGGMGMGLSITRSIIDGHGGRLWATPNATHGATFQFALPRI
jgi:PAS domain S-box-containing protein